jgi:hypothetical protein
VQAGRSTRGIRDDDDSLRGKKLGRQAGGEGFGQGQQYRSDREERTPLRIDVGNMIRTGERKWLTTPNTNEPVMVSAMTQLPARRFHHATARPTSGPARITT